MRETTAATGPIGASAERTREHRERAYAGLLLAAGWTLIYLAMLDQGVTLFHELFHDARHLSLFPCH
jgi:hypothetical protein